MGWGLDVTRNQDGLLDHLTELFFGESASAPEGLLAKVVPWGVHRSKDKSGRRAVHLVVRHVVKMQSRRQPSPHFAARVHAPLAPKQLVFVGAAALQHPEALLELS